MKKLGTKIRCFLKKENHKKFTEENIIKRSTLNYCKCAVNFLCSHHTFIYFTIGSKSQKGLLPYPGDSLYKVLYDNFNKKI